MSDPAPSFDDITRQLRLRNWYAPPPGYPCGCVPLRLCTLHARQRMHDDYDREYPR